MIMFGLLHMLEEIRDIKNQLVTRRTPEPTMKMNKLPVSSKFCMMPCNNYVAIRAGMLLHSTLCSLSAIIVYLEILWCNFVVPDGMHL